MSIFISSGEASGDHYMARLAQVLKEGGYTDSVWGMGGVESRRSGIECLWESSRLQLTGLAEVIPTIPYALRLIRDVTNEITARGPEAVALIDCPEFHMRLAPRLRKKGYTGRIIYVAPPSIWAWRSGRAAHIAKYFDESLPLFEFEHRALVERGCVSRWKGHPLLEEFDEPQPDPNLSANSGTRVGFFPGSRTNEIKHLLPVMADTAERLKAEGLRPVFSVAPGLERSARSYMKSVLEERGLDYYSGPGRKLLFSSECAVAASGTITLEALLAGCYTIVTYRFNAVTEFIARRTIKLDLFALPNITAGKEVFPELIKDGADPVTISGRVMEWIDADESFKRTKMEEIRAARRGLGEPGVYEFWAERIAGV